MPEPLSADRTAEMLLWYFEQPTRYDTEGVRRDAPFLDAEVVLKLALGRRAGLDPALRHGAGSTSHRLQAAAAMYVHRLFFRPDATPYQTLGLLPGASPEAVKESFRLLMQLVHPDRQDEMAQWPDAFAAQANRAYGVLRNEDSRAQFDRDAASRAAMERAMQRADAAPAASKAAFVQRPQRRSGSEPSAAMQLPAWLTEGVGGYVRKHPAVTAFTLFTAVALVTVGIVVSDQQEDRLTRDARDVQASPAPKARPGVQSVAGAARASDEAYSPVANSSKRAEPAPAVPMRNAEPSTMADGTAADRSSPRTTVAAVPPPSGVDRAVAPPVVVASSGAAPAGSPPTTHAETAVARAQTPGSERTVPTPASSPPPIARAEEAAAAPIVSQPPIARAELPAATPTPTPAPIARAEPPAAIVPSGSTVGIAASAPDSARSSSASGVPAVVAVPAQRPEQVATVAAVAVPSPPAATEIEALFVTFVDTYERGRLDAFAALFDENADTNLRRGRAAIRGEYDELFRLSEWRKMQLKGLNWQRVGDRAIGKGEIMVKIGWRDGREVEQRLAVDMELVRRDGRVVIAKLAHQPKN